MYTTSYRVSGLMKSMLMIKIEREVSIATRSPTLVKSDRAPRSNSTAFRSCQIKHGREKHPSVLLLVSSTSVRTFSSRSIEGLEIPTVRMVCAHFERPLRPAEVSVAISVVMVVGAVIYTYWFPVIQHVLSRRWRRSALSMDRGEAEPAKVVVESGGFFFWLLCVFFV